MASSVTSSTSASANSLYGVSYSGISGLVSGLDTESLIDGMTAGTRSKIAKQLQNKQLLSWKTEAFRSVSDKLISFSEKYTSYSSKTNLISSSFFNQNKITALGENSDLVTVSGSSDTAENLSICGVKQLATTSTMALNKASDKVLSTGELDLNGETTKSTFSVASLSVDYGGSRYYIQLDQGAVYDGTEDLATALQNKIDTDSDLMNLKGKVTFGNDGDKLTMQILEEDTNTLKVAGGNDEFLSAVGFSVGDSLSSTGETMLTGSKAASLTEITSVKESLAGKNLTFTYNGVSKTIQFPTQEELATIDTGDKFAQVLQDKLDKAFGTGRVQVEFDETKDTDGTILSPTKGALKMTTTDATSVLAMSAGDAEILSSKGVFQVPVGASNRVNLQTSIKDSGLSGGSDFWDNVFEGGKECEFTINDVKFTVKAEDTIADLMKKVNDSDAKVRMSYSATSDTFQIKSTESGSGGAIKIQDVQDKGTFAASFFGTRQVQEDGTVTTTGGTVEQGKDAIATVSFGDGTNTMEVVRGSNTFTLDGLTIGLKEKFGEYDEDGNFKVDSAKPITFSSKVDSDSIVDAIKSMVKDYNEMVETVNDQLSTKPDRDYAPLTAEQKEEMSEKQIEQWETKAKSGMLFNDTDLSSLSQKLRFTFSNVSSRVLSGMGITTSSNWKDNGKITLDEDKLRAALEERPDEVQDIFTAPKTEDSKGGVLVGLKETLDYYAKTTGATKGLLIEKAGSTSSPTSLLSNRLLKQMNSIDDIVTKLKATLKTETTRYTNQFTQMEQVISQLNTQSSWFSQQMS